MRLKIILIDDIQDSINDFGDILKIDTNFELVNNHAFVDRGSSIYYDQNEQKKNIIKELQNLNYDIVLIDLFLRQDDENKNPEEMENATSISLISMGIEEYLINENKEFAFITSHNEWTYNKFKYIKDINGVSNQWKFMKWAGSAVNRKRTNCPYEPLSPKPCKDTFSNCTTNDCLRRTLKGLFINE